jgi:hypothetical protein
MRTPSLVRRPALHNPPRSHGYWSPGWSRPSPACCDRTRTTNRSSIRTGRRPRRIGSARIGVDSSFDPCNASSPRGHGALVRTKEGDTMETSMDGGVLVQTNAAHNEVIAFSRAANGTLAGVSSLRWNLGPVSPKHEVVAVDRRQGCLEAISDPSPPNEVWVLSRLPERRRLHGSVGRPSRSGLGEPLAPLCCCHSVEDLLDPFHVEFPQGLEAELLEDAAHRMICRCGSPLHVSLGRSACPETEEELRRRPDARREWRARRRP